MTVTVTIDTILVQDSEPVAATIDDDVVMLSIRAGAYFGFNQAGSAIWNMLGEPRSVGQVCESISQLYDGDVEVMTRDVTQFLQTLLERRLLHVVDPGRSG